MTSRFHNRPQTNEAITEIARGGGMAEETPKSVWGHIPDDRRPIAMAALKALALPGPRGEQMCWQIRHVLDTSGAKDESKAPTQLLPDINAVRALSEVPLIQPRTPAEVEVGVADKAFR
jgi:hypothetical protein